MDSFLKPYMVGDNPQVTENNICGLSIIDVKWNYNFIGGKSERTKVINHLKKNGYVHQNSVYIKNINNESNCK